MFYTSLHPWVFCILYSVFCSSIRVPESTTMNKTVHDTELKFDIVMLHNNSMSESFMNMRL